jgi:hypothetical protein
LHKLRPRQLLWQELVLLLVVKKLIQKKMPAKEEQRKLVEKEQL